MHDIRRWAFGAIQVGHNLHGGVDMCEEFFVGRSEVVEAPFAIGCPREAVLGAFAVAGKAHATVAAILWELVTLGVAEIGGHLAVC